MSKVNYGWLKTYSDEYFAPKTLLSQICNDNGNLLADKSTIGNASTPVYLKNGQLTACGSLGIRTDAISSTSTKYYVLSQAESNTYTNLLYSTGVYL
jgi:hypothetical protein